jgi:hypothetical protein
MLQRWCLVWVIVTWLLHSVTGSLFMLTLDLLCGRNFAECTSDGEYHLVLIWHHESVAMTSSCLRFVSINFVPVRPWCVVNIVFDQRCVANVGNESEATCMSFCDRNSWICGLPASAWTWSCAPNPVFSDLGLSRLGCVLVLRWRRAAACVSGDAQPGW